MRRVLFIVLVVGLLGVPTAGGTVARTTGSSYLQLLDGHGTAKVKRHGNFFGRVGRGRVVATRNVIVSGWEHRRAVSRTLVEYRGRGVTFRTPGTGKWRLRLYGRNVDASGFVRGCMTLNGVDSGDPGQFRLGASGQLRPWPRAATRYQLGAGC